MKRHAQHKRMRALLIAALLCLAALGSALLIYAFSISSPKQNLEATSAEYYGEAGALLRAPSAARLNSKGQLVVADADASALVFLNKAGAEVTRVDADFQMQAPFDVLAIGGKLYVSDPAAQKVFELDEKGSLRQTYLFENTAPYALAQSQDGSLLLATSRGLTSLAPGQQSDFKLRALSSETSTSLVSGLVELQDGSIILASDSKLIAFENASLSKKLWETRLESVAGIALAPDESRLFVATPLSNAVREFSPQDGRELEPSLSLPTLSFPQALSVQEGRLLIADRGHGRILSLELEPSVLQGSFAYLYLIPLLLLAGAAFSLLSIFFFRERAYSFDLAACEEIIACYPGRPFASVLSRVYMPELIAEQARASFFDVEVIARKVKDSGVQELLAHYEEIDSIDAQSLELVRSLSNSVLVASRPELIAAARGLGLEVLSLEEFMAQNDDTDKGAPALPESEDKMQAEHAGEKANPSSSHSLDDKLKTPLLLLVLILCASHGLSLQAPLHADEAPALIRVKLPLASESETSSTNQTTAHDKLIKDCQLCHSSAPQAALISERLERPSSCELCHAPASSQSLVTAYTAARGSARNFDTKDSGHQIGLSRYIPNSSDTTELFELSCYSCHSPIANKEMVTCESCHDLSLSAGESKARPNFEINDLTRAHQASADLYAQGHMTTAGECYSCHRGNLDPGKDCAICHYNSFDFARDTQRAKGASDWPHASSGDRALLGNWEVTGEAHDLSTQLLTQPATLAKPEAQRSEKADKVSSYCTRCHYSSDDKTLALSVHDLVHDPSRAAGEPKLEAPRAESILATTSQGYIRTGKYQTKPLSILPPESGDTASTYSNVDCTLCHMSNVAAEHMLRSEASCSICHESINPQALRTPESYQSDIRPGINPESFVSCGTGEKSCHAQNWHGFNADRVRDSHSLPKTKQARSCSRDDKGNPLCHADNSSESLFAFGDKDLASAHNDYWSAQHETHVTNTKYESKTLLIDDVRGCTLCHSAEIETMRIKSCSDCHVRSNKIYAEANCYYADMRSFESSETTSGMSEVEVAAYDYLAELKTRQEAARIQAAELREQQEKQESEKPILPPSFRPVTGMMPLNSKLSVSGKLLSGKPSLINKNAFIGMPQQIK